MLIDFHAHVFPERVAAAALGKLAAISKIQPCTDGTVACTSAFMGGSGVERYVVANIATNAAQTTNVNNFAIGLLSDTRIIPFGSVYPDADNALPEIARLRQAGIKGIKLHPEYQQFFVENRACYNIVERALSYDMIVLLHAGHDVAYPNTYNSPPKALRKLSDEFKSDKIVFAHLGGFAASDEVLEELVGCDACFDTACTACSTLPTNAKAIIAAHGSEKILFGSDCPWERPQATYDFLQRLGLTNAQLENITHINAERLLGI